jgi:hypothetical protein
MLTKYIKYFLEICIKKAVKFGKSRSLVGVYQTMHLSLGFIRDPMGQLNSFENSGRFEREPMTLKLGGE